MKSSTALSIGLVLIAGVFVVVIITLLVPIIQKQLGGSALYGEVPRQLCGMLGTSLSGSMTKGAKIVAVDQGDGSIHALTNALPDSIRATGTSDIGGAACVLTEDSVVQVVYYVPPSNPSDRRNQCHRIQKKYTVYLIDRATQRTVSRSTFSGSMPAQCPRTAKQGDFLRYEGNLPDLAPIADWLFKAIQAR